MPGSERRLAAIMFTDIVGYTALGQRSESVALETLEQHRELLRPIFSKHRGREVKTIGDAFLVEFGSALEAMLCAIDVQNSVHSMNLERGGKLQIRIGIHVGDVVHRGGDVLGDAVNVSSRIEPLAEPGGVCISEQVYDQVVNKVDLPFLRLEGVSMKNVHLPIEVYRVIMPWSEGGAGALAGLDRHRIAVMPLVNMISDPNDEYFADGMTEELISAVSKVRGLSVISRTSIMRYKNQSKSAMEVGRELKTGTLLEGSVRKAGNRVRIAVQLINAETDEHLWAENYDRTLEDVFSIQSDIAKSVASALKITLLETDRRRLERVPTKDPGAHALYLKGRSYRLKATEEDLKEATKFFQKAIDKDPQYALAYAWLAETTLLMGVWDMIPPTESFQKGEELAMSALALDPSLPEAHGALGFALSNQWDYKAAMAEYDRALDLDPNSATILSDKARLMTRMMRFDEAERLARRALELDPLSPATLQAAATQLLYSGHPDDAIALYRKVLEIDPEASFAKCNIGVAYVQKGMIDEGIALIRDAISMTKAFSPSKISDLAHALGRAGRFGELRELLTETLEWHEKNHRGAIALASIFANLGEKDEAFEWLEKAFEEHSGPLPLIAQDFSFDNLRSDPRWDSVMGRLGLG